MLKRLHFAGLLLSVLAILAACSRGGGDGGQVPDGKPGAVNARGNDASISQVVTAVRALAQPDPSVDFVAAEMKGVIEARTKSQALMHYDGYRVTLTTPANRVTQITFYLIDAKPSVQQVSEKLGTPQEVPKGMLYEYDSPSTGATIRILAEPVSMPPKEDSLVRRIVIEGARTR